MKTKSVLLMILVGAGCVGLGSCSTAQREDGSARDQASIGNAGLRSPASLVDTHGESAGESAKDYDAFSRGKFRDR